MPGVRDFSGPYIEFLCLPDLTCRIAIYFSANIEFFLYLTKISSNLLLGT